MALPAAFLLESGLSSIRRQCRWRNGSVFFILEQVTLHSVPLATKTTPGAQSKREGRMGRPCSLMDPLWVQHPSSHLPDCKQPRPAEGSGPHAMSPEDMDL